MNDGQIYSVLGLAVVYAPFLVAYGLFRGSQGGGVWKFLSFCCCTLALVSAFGVSFVLGTVLWLLAWLFAGVTQHTARRDAVENATLRALQEQNELLKKQAAQSANSTEHLTTSRC